VTQPDDTILSRLRSICLALPEAVEKETWEAPTFRIRDKIFAMVHTADGRASMWCKAPPGVQGILVGAAPERFFSPPYVGPKGWIGIWLEAAVDWDELADLVGRSYRMTAPKRLLTNGRLLTNARLLSSPADTPASPSRQRSPPSRRPKRRTPTVSTR